MSKWSPGSHIAEVDLYLLISGFKLANEPAHYRLIKDLPNSGGVDCIDQIVMQGFRKQLAEAEAKAAFGDAEAAEEAEYFRLSIKRRSRDREKMIAGITTTFSRMRRAWREA
jgi:hypothetical protein